MVKLTVSIVCSLIAISTATPLFRRDNPSDLADMGNGLQLNEQETPDQKQDHSDSHKHKKHHSHNDDVTQDYGSSIPAGPYPSYAPGGLNMGMYMPSPPQGMMGLPHPYGYGMMPPQYGNNAPDSWKDNLIQYLESQLMASYMTQAKLEVEMQGTGAGDSNTSGSSGLPNNGLPNNGIPSNDIPSNVPASNGSGGYSLTGSSGSDDSTGNGKSNSQTSYLSTGKDGGNNDPSNDTPDIDPSLIGIQGNRTAGYDDPSQYVKSKNGSPSYSPSGKNDNVDPTLIQGTPSFLNDKQDVKTSLTSSEGKVNGSSNLKNLQLTKSGDQNGTVDPADDQNLGSQEDGVDPNSQVDDNPLQKRDDSLLVDDKGMTLNATANSTYTSGLNTTNSTDTSVENMLLGDDKGMFLNATANSTYTPGLNTTNSTDTSVENTTPFLLSTIDTETGKHDESKDYTPSLKQKGKKDDDDNDNDNDDDNDNAFSGKYSLKKGKKNDNDDDDDDDNDDDDDDNDGNDNDDDKVDSKKGYKYSKSYKKDQDQDDDGEEKSEPREYFTTGEYPSPSPSYEFIESPFSFDEHTGPYDVKEKMRKAYYSSMFA